MCGACSTTAPCVHAQNLHQRSRVCDAGVLRVTPLRTRDVRLGNTQQSKLFRIVSDCCKLLGKGIVICKQIAKNVLVSSYYMLVLTASSGSSQVLECLGKLKKKHIFCFCSFRTRVTSLRKRRISDARSKQNKASVTRRSARTLPWRSMLFTRSGPSVCGKCAAQCAGSNDCQSVVAK